jgi:predicted GNAT family N-acyltransferase
MPYKCRVAHKQKEFDQVARLRCQCFKEEQGLLASVKFPVEREFGPIDTLESTIHFLVTANETPVGTARVLLPNQELARESNSRLGLVLEKQYRLVRGLGRRVKAAEISRLCLLKQSQGTKALLTLYAAILKASRRLGLTHWLGATNLETASLEEASKAYHIAQAKGLLCRGWRLEPREPTTLVESSHSHGELATLKLPPILGLLCKMVGAKIAGPPSFDAYMGRYSIPIVIDLDRIPPATRRLLALSRRRGKVRRRRA